MAAPDHLLDDLLKAIKNLADHEDDGAEPVEEVEWEGVVTGELESVRQVVLRHPELLDQVGPDRFGVVHHAVMKGKLETVKYLVDMCANINIFDGAGRTPLDLCEHCPEPIRSDMILFLVQKGGKRKNLTPRFDDRDTSFTDVGMTSSSTNYDMLEPVVVSPSYDAQQYDALWEDALEIPTVPVDTVSFTDPNTGNNLNFFLEDDKRLRYDISGEKRPPFKRLMFSHHPPRMMLPDIGVCVTLPTDATKLATILGGIRYMAGLAGVDNDIPQKMKVKKETVHWRSDATSNLIIVTVIPQGRGKTFISQRLCRWLNWKGIRSRIFHSSNDQSAVSAMLAFLKDNPGSAGILGATQCTKEAREDLISRLLLHSDLITKERILFIDSAGPKDSSDEIPNYTPLSEETDQYLSWVQLSSSHAYGGPGGRVHINRVSAHLSQKLLYFMLNLSQLTTPIYLVRTGESLYQVENRLGGNSRLTAAGWQHAAAVRRFFNLPKHNFESMQIFSSTNIRAVEAQSMFQGKRFINFQYKTLNEINAGECDGLRPDEIKKRFPQLWGNREKDKYNYGWPNGESYQNMNQRLEQVILDIHHCDRPLVIMGHLDVCRGLYAYLSELLPELCIYLTLPQKHVFEFTYDTDKRMVQVTAYDISRDIERAAAEGISNMNQPSQEFLRGIPEEPQKVPVPVLPPHIHDIATSHAHHAKCLSLDNIDFTPPPSSPLGTPA
eukprot:TRINITY_DN816_c0_g1_i4.p1 TRINITY_DN816_c0_g1~~TRINITY_DN816_c0_g1_i4.p1  ORF type:complete len:733 (+),score=134.62 TRINITY_DN816_c0_g1_i4:38-2200(+)